MIGDRVQIGSDTQLVAPVTVGDDAYIGAGTTVTGDVPAGHWWSVACRSEPSRAGSSADAPGLARRRRSHGDSGAAQDRAAQETVLPSARSSRRRERHAPTAGAEVSADVWDHRIRWRS